MTIHTTHPFLGPDREPARQFRGRLGARVSLWTAGDLRVGAAGLTVSSMVVGGGDPWRVLALLDPAADLTESLLATTTAVVNLLDWRHRQLAEAFAGVAPAPGGRFTTAEFNQTTHGPRLADVECWATVRLESVVEVGWSSLVTCTIDQVTLGDDDQPLHHVRGRYVNGARRA